ncbi:MAG: tyrosine-type recombinase/integrase [Lachnospiraceae bacterium]|nr:tyrosine-type recombinase/integrase [Lachnospiraceae bacterium]
MKEKRTNEEILIGLCRQLPEFAVDFLLTRDQERTSSTRVGYARDFLVFLEYLCGEFPEEIETKDITPEHMDQVTPQDIDIFLTKYAKTHKPRVVSHMKTSISAFYTYLCYTMRQVEKNPCEGAQKIRIPQKDYVIYLTEEEQEKLLATIEGGVGLTEKQQVYHKFLKKRDIAIIFLFLDTGLRVSELCSLRIRNLDIRSHSLNVVRKRGKESQIFYSDKAGEYIMEYLQERKACRPHTYTPDSPLFLTLQNTPISLREVQSMVPKYVQAALPEKMQKISPHKLRSTFAMSFYAATHDILTLQARMGHESLTTTNIYVKAAKENIRNSRNWR